MALDNRFGIINTQNEVGHVFKIAIHRSIELSGASFWADMHMIGL